MLNKSAIVCVVALLVSLNVWADDNYLEKPPVIPEPLADGESIEPEINIIQENDRTVEEYRLNGELYMVKVTPAVGPAYYYIDTDGDGSLESKQFELQSGLVPNWILFKW
ncbi:MAG: DUF2782 domain-containing protein [Gammaproteobacteria bacterium]|nr:DUF2782 domain-containing protein [Gammaproteobacteria bacterium]